MTRLQGWGQFEAYVMESRVKNEYVVKLPDGTIVVRAQPSAGKARSLSLSRMHGQNDNGPPKNTPNLIRPVSYFQREQAQRA